MKKVCLLFLTLLNCHFLAAQCECTNCPLFIPSNDFRTSTINISGATNNTLGQNDQGLCYVCIEFDTDAIKELSMTLTAPDGSTVILMEDSGINVNANMDFDICFIACGLPPAPDPGHQGVFDTDDNWEANTNFVGEYHPFIGCLEDFTGNVNGDWTLRLEDDTFFDETTLLQWFLIFRDADGIGCPYTANCSVNTCSADAGTIITSSTEVCPSETINITIQNYQQSSDFIQYILITNLDNEIVEIFQGDNYDFSADTCAEFKVFAYNKEIISSATDPNIGDVVNTYDCNTECCELSSSRTISFIDLIAPVFTNPPENPNFPGGGPFTEVYCADDITNPSLAYTDNCISNGDVDPLVDNQTVPCNGGQIIRSWEVADSCNTQFLEQTIQIAPSPIPEYIDPPADIIVDCDQIPENPLPLEYSNGITGSCLINGFVDPIIEEDYNICGGELRFIWSVQDDCDRLIEYTQFITVNPATEAVFINPPLDQTINCDEVPLDAPDLEYDNLLENDCNISGSIEATREDDYDACGGEVRFIWVFEDECDRNIEHIQFLEIRPAPEPEFIDPPEDEIITCDQIPLTGPSLVITNNEIGNCLIEDIVDPIVIDNTIDCAGEVFIEWSYTDPCGIDHFYRQILTIKTIPNISIDLDTVRICEGNNFDLSEIQVTDLNSTDAILSYHDASPPNESNAITNLLVSPLTNSSYYLMLSTADGCVDFTEVVIIVEQAINIADDGQGTICNDNSSYNLFDFLQNISDRTGTWLDLDNSGIILNDPTDVNFNNIVPNQYRFSYQTASLNACPPDTAIALIIVNERLQMNALQVDCSTDLNSFSVRITSNNDASISNNIGTLSNLGANEYLISDIPIDDTLRLQGADLNGCLDSLNIIPPNCNCPTVELPISNGNQSICEGEQNIPLSVSLAVDQTAAWYSAPIGGTLLDSATTTFTSTETFPNIYTYYVESINTNNPSCRSLTRTAIEFAILAKPIVEAASLSACDASEIIFNLEEANTQISTNPNYSISYHETLENAENDIDALSNVYTISNSMNENLFVRVSNSENCFSITNLDLNIDALPVTNINFEDNDTLTCQRPTLNLNSTGSSSGMHTYEWYNVDGRLSLFTNEPTITISSEGWYYLEVIDDNTNCRSLDSILIYKSDDIPSIDLANELIGICGEENSNIEALISSGDNATINWTTNDGIILSNPNNAIIDIQGAGTYTIEVVNTNSQCSTRDSVIFITRSTPILQSLEVVNDDCSDVQNGSLSFSPFDEDNLPFTYFINGTNYTSNQISNLAADTYEIQITDANGCTLDTVAEILSPSNFEIMLPSSLNFSFTAENILEASVSITDDEIQSIQWSPNDNLSCSNCLNPSLLNSGINEYTISVVDTNGCINTKSIQILINTNLDIFIPNVFSPNGDNINDFFQVHYNQDLQLTNLELKVYDRWGNKVFEGDQLQNGTESDFWDGTYKGQRLNAGVFIYVVVADLSSREEQIILKGDVTLIR